MLAATRSVAGCEQQIALTSPDIGVPAPKPNAAMMLLSVRTAARGKAPHFWWILVPSFLGGIRDRIKRLC